MSELTKEYFDQQFDDLLRAVKEGFDATATKAELEEVRQELKAEIREVRQELKAEIREVRQELKQDISDLQFKLNQLADIVKEFVTTVRKQEAEYVELKVKYHELEKRVARLESGFQAA